jgi:signal transduction histidine kinase
MKFYLWILGGTFALLGSVVVVRRPDLRSAWLFWAFSGIMAAALGAGPSAAGPAPSWARILEGLAVIGIGAVVLSFASSLVQGTSPSRRWSPAIQVAPILGVLIALLYGLSLLFAPSWYSVLQPVIYLYTSLFALCAVILLALQSIRRRHTSDHYQSSIPLFGIGLGILPFAVLSIVPKSAGWSELVPQHVSIMFLALMPVAFAYAILQHQLLGIRRLVHRGMVYALATSGLFVLAVIGFNFVAPSIDATNRYGPSIFAGMLVLAVVLFIFLRRAARYVIDRFIYRDTADLMSFWGAVDHFSSSDDTKEVAKAMTEHLVGTFNLESALLFLDDDVSQSLPAAQAGSRARETLVRIYPDLQRLIETAGEAPITELRWESDSLLVVNLLLGDRRLGNILLGPKKGGDVFLETEKSMIATLAPVISLGLGKTLLSEELRELNRRMINAQEMERARVAADIHDGPLQKATLLVAAAGTDQRNRTEIARQLVQDLREVGSRLRPAILDDLGIVAAVDWLLEGTAKRHGMSVHFQLNGIAEEARFDADVELALFRIAQEAVNNVVKHSRGNMLTVSLSRSSNRLILNVEDDGVGFDIGKSRNGGSGLSGMRERATQVDGSVVVTSKTGVGTLVTADVPMIELKYE